MELNARRRWESAQKFFGARIWAAGVDEVRRGRALLYRAARILYATVRGYREKRLNFRAAALTYFAVLSVVPFLAFTFSVVKGFGLYQRLVNDNIRPYLISTFGENPALLRAFDQLLGFVEHTDFAKMGAITVLFLVYSSISLLSTIETALNDIWDAKTARPLLRQITDYTTLLVVTPLLMLAAITLRSAAESSWIMTFLKDTLSLGIVIDFLFKLASVVFICVALFALYMLMPNVRTRATSAALGGVTAGLLWQGVLILYVKAQVGVANYNAIYAGFGAVPIFLVWLYISWMVVLLGALLAASHQNEQGLRQAMQARQVDQELREVLSVAIAAEASRRFLDGAKGPAENELAGLLDAPVPTVQEVVAALVKAGVLARVVCGPDLTYLPARDIDNTRLSDVRDAVRAATDAAKLKAAVEGNLRDSLRQLIHLADQAVRDGSFNLTLRQLAQHAVRPAGSRAAETNGGEILDAKQPTVPA
jgi:membrane protein